MKLRNLRRRQWERYVTRLDELRKQLPPRAVDPDPFWGVRDPIVVLHRGYLRRSRRDSRRWMIRSRHRWQRTSRWVEHDCVWEPTDLPINAAGDTRPGFQCTYELENGQGRCESNVFDLADVCGKAACIVWKGGPGW